MFRSTDPPNKRSDTVFNSLNRESRTSIDRRHFMYGLGASMGTVAMNAMLAAEQQRDDAGPLQVKPQHLPAKAKHCIFLYMAGGPSHIDTFDPKPALDKLDMQKFQRQGYEGS